MTTSAKSTFDLNDVTFRLLADEPFFAALSRRLDKRASTQVPTAGVRITDEGRFEMVYNPDFMQRMVDESPEDRPLLFVKGVLKHEFYHLVFGHCGSRLPEGGMSKVWNFATDLAINSHIADELPEWALLPGRAPYETFPLGLSAEGYLKLLKEQGEGEGEGEGGEGQGDGDQQGSGGSSGDPSDEDGDSSGSGQTLDDHSGWGEADGTDINSEQAQQRLREMLKEAKDEADRRGWGSVSSGTRRQIKEALETRVDWRSVLRSFVKASQRAAKRNTVRRINRRYPYIHAGNTRTRLARLAISIDQSGSVSDSMLAAFYAELEKLASLAEFTVVPFDTRVDESKVFVWKKGQKLPWERVLCGGTDFDAPTRFVNEGNFDGHIVLTDMGAPKPIPSQCQRIWMTDAANVRYMPFTTHERVLVIDE